ncbi:MAG: hypothetical protein FJX54_20555 [Alphaproteobacteria bacterium]|nr:hypothetical protein [Alphaproteobacteria bacterium]
MAITVGLLLVQPASAVSWRDGLAASAGSWIEWGRSTAATMSTEASSAVDQAIIFAKSYGPSFPSLEADASKMADEWSDTVKQSIGCVVGGAAGTSAAILAGGENLVNIIAGGVVVPANPVVLSIGLFGVVFASFCAVGQALTPLYIHYFEAPDPSPPASPRPAPLPNQSPSARVYYISAP